MKASARLALAAAIAVSASIASGARAAGDDSLLADAQRLFAPLPGPASQPPDGVALGRRLFFEPRAAADGVVSCAHCHQPQLHGADGLPKSIGAFGKPNAHNAPTVFNAFLNFKQHWRGERESLEDQAEKSLLGPASFGNLDYSGPMRELKMVPAYRELFAKAFPEDANPVNEKNWAKAIAAYERTLASPSRFDAFLEGDAKALTDAEKQGLRKFIDLGCANCHNGAGVGGNSFQKFGIFGGYWKETGAGETCVGRAGVTSQPADLHVFKVASLRNVEKTAPYFHDGSVAELPRAVEIMGKTQLGLELAKADVTAIVSFLGALTGPVPDNFSPPPDTK